jgi:hypothetical protein
MDDAQGENGSKMKKFMDVLQKTPVGRTYSL